MTKKGFLTGVFVAAVAVGGGLGGGKMVDNSLTHKLEKAGYTDVALTSELFGRQGCDFFTYRYGDRFTAKDSSGQPASGKICFNILGPSLIVPNKK